MDVRMLVGQQNIPARFSRRIALLILVMGLTGCNSTWFYQPNDKVYRSLGAISSRVPLFLNSYSGNQLHTLFIPAEGKTENTLLVHFHGNAGNITWTSRRYGWLRNYGVDLLVFDYSGYGQSTGTPSPETTWQDALTILDYALEQKRTERWDRIILAGTSLGGNILLHALAGHPQKDEFDRVFIDSSFMSYEDVAAGIVAGKPGETVAGILARWVISDEFAPIKFSPIQLNVPVVVSHCTDDQLIGIDLGESLYAGIDSPDKQWLELGDCAHAQGFTEQYPGHRQQLIQALLYPAD